MATVALIACSKSKADQPSPAADLYTSALFEKSKTYAHERADKWFILSAKHGILDPKVVIEPYDKTLKKMPKNERAAWSEKVFERLRQHLAPGDHILFVAGKDYREFLAAKLTASGFSVQTPLEGLSLGMQLRTLDRLNATANGRKHVERFYDILDKLSTGLNGGRLLGECLATNGWPERGVYFLFEPGEMRRDDQTTHRVTRIGTHAVSKGSKSTLWRRLATHRGTEAGGGSHRSSVFRLHVGAALIRKSQGNFDVHTWGQGQHAPKKVRTAELPIERQVSSFLRAVHVLWLNVPDEPGPASDRAFIERNVIALLSNSSYNRDRPSGDWLGNFSLKKDIRYSGLWNVNHVGEPFDERVFQVFEKYVEITLGSRKPLKRSLAPKHWHSSLKGDLISKQFQLF